MRQRRFINFPQGIHGWDIIIGILCVVLDFLFYDVQIWMTSFEKELTSDQVRAGTQGVTTTRTLGVRNGAIGLRDKIRKARMRNSECNTQEHSMEESRWRGRGRHTSNGEIKYQSPIMIAYI